MATRTMQIVVAHCDEDLSWLEPCLSECQIYSKGTTVPPGAMQLPNIGREGHTYLFHIIANYYNLADVTIFTQGRIEDHLTEGVSSMRNGAEKLDPGNILTFSNLQSRCELEVFKAWNGQNRQLVRPELYGPGPTEYAAHRPGHYFARFMGDGKVPLCIGFQPFAIFGVPKELILARSLQYYEDLMSAMFLGDNACNNPETGHFMEKFWFAMWKPEEYICWKKEDISKVERNEKGHLAKGRWRVNTKDECIMNFSSGSSDASFGSS